MAAGIDEPPPRGGMFASAVPAGRVFEVPLRVHWSAPLLVLLLGVNLGAGLLPAWAPGRSGGGYFLGAVLGALLLVGSLLVHEGAHALTARHHGVPVTDMTLWALGGVTRMGRPRTAGEEGRIAVSGPLASAGLGGLFLGAAFALLKGAHAELPGDVLLWLGWANLLLAGFNLVPAAPLDGGHVLEALVWARTGRRDRAELVAARSGQAAGLGLAALGFFGMVRGNLGGLWLVLVGLFISMSAQAQARWTALLHMVEGVPVREAMSAPVETGPDWLSVEEFTRLHALTARHSHLPLRDPNGAVTGIVSLRVLSTVPPERASTVRVSEVARPIGQCATAPPEQSVAQALTALDAGDPMRILVMDGARLVGILTSHDISRLVQQRVLRQAAGR